MKMSLKNYRKELRDSLLDLAWVQWSALGVAGHVTRFSSYVVDVEALVLFTIFIGRYDERLFDSMQDWLQTNGRFVNTQRLKVLAKKNGFRYQRELAYVAANQNAFENKSKWKNIADSVKITSGDSVEPLFKDIPLLGKQLKDPLALKFGLERNIYKYAGKNAKFDDGLASLMLRLRGLFGVNSRVEIMLLLLSNDFCKIQDLAKRSGYSWRSVQDILFEMTFGDIVQATASKKNRVYSLPNKNHWLKALGFQDDEPIRFPQWDKALFSLELIYETLENPLLDKLSDMSVQGAVNQSFKKIGTSFLECNIRELQTVSSNSWLEIPEMMSRIFKK